MTILKKLKKSLVENNFYFIGDGNIMKINPITGEKIPLNEDEETLNEYAKIEERKQTKKKIKKFFIVIGILLCAFAFIIKLADPAFLAFVSASLFLASFSGRNN